MKAKEYLQQLKRLDTMINQKNQELGDLRLRAKCAGSVNYSQERVQTSPTGEGAFAKLVEKILDLESEINIEIDVFIDKKHAIINQIQSLQNTDYTKLLYKRYVEYKSLERICVEMGFSYNYIKHLHGYALQNFQEKILNSTPNDT